MKLNHIIKTVLSLSLALLMLCSLPIAALAAQPEEPIVQPRWTSIFTMDVDMSFVNGLGNAAATARKQSTASHITGTLYVYKWTGSSWEYLGHAEGSKSVGTLGLSVDFACEIGVQYLAVLTVCAFTNGIGEWETIEYYETCR